MQFKTFFKYNIAEVRIFSRDKKKQNDMRKEYNNSKFKFYIGSVRDPNSLKDALKGVDFVFHAGVLKQVPSCESFPIEAVYTNSLAMFNALSSWS